MVAMITQCITADSPIRIWDGLHASPRLAPSKGAKLCTYFAWFLRPGRLGVEPYFDIPMPLSRMRLLMQFRMGSHSLPVEQGRLARPMVPRQLRRCMLCSTYAIGNKRHYVFDCTHFAHMRQQFRSLFHIADGAMQWFMFIISRDVFSSVLSSELACQRFDSDHKPVLLIDLLHDTAAAAANDSTRPAQPGAPIPRLQWDGAKKAGYVQRMQEQRAALADCHSKVHANQLDLAFQQLGGIMVQAASGAGCRNASGSGAHKGLKGKPYFDRECLELRAKFRYALRHDVDSVKVFCHPPQVQAVQAAANTNLAQAPPQ